MSENNVIIRIKGETQLQNAQSELTRLQEENNRLMDSAKKVGKEMDSEAAKLTALKEKLKENIAQVKEQVKNKEKLRQAIAPLVAEYQKDVKAINDTIKAKIQEKKALQDSTRENEKSIVSLKNSIRTYNAVNGAGVQTRQQLMAIREELVKMAEAGDTTSAEFIALAERAGELNDTVGDAQQVIALLASDTKKLDAAMQVGGGLVGAFNAATSAAALLGGESEKLQEAFLKVQAAMSVLNGIQQMMTVLDKRSAANVVIRTALIKLFNKEKIKEAATQTAATVAAKGHENAIKSDAAATATATLATKGFTKALLANPVMLVVAALAALVAGISYYISKTKEAKGATKDFNAELERINNYNQRSRSEWEHNARMAEIEGKTWREVHAIRKQGVEDELAVWQERKRNQERIKREDALWGREWTEQEEEYLQEINKMIQQYQDERRDLNWEYQEREAAENMELAKKNQEELDAQLKARQDALIKAAQEEAEIKRILNNLNPDSQYIVDDEGVIWTKKELAVLEYKKALDEANKSLQELNEQEEEVNIASYESFVELTAKKMALEGKSESEIWDYKYSRMTYYIQKQQEALRTRLGDEAEFSQEMIDLSNQLADLQIQNAERASSESQAIMQSNIDFTHQLTQDILTFAGDMAAEIFGVISDSISRQMEQLDEMYTTDAEEARDNAKKKYISEKELEDKKLALKRKAAAAEKASALFSIALNTAMAIMQAIAQFGPPPSPMGIAGIAMASALGLAQLAIAAAKPLPQYAKGRKSGKGEYALVGEKGPEVMYIPPGASIVPNNLIPYQSKWAAFGVPIPSVENTSDLRAFAGSEWDYDRLGKAIAENMPKTKAVSVNIDRSGITVQSGNDTHTYMNTKYTGTWN